MSPIKSLHQLRNEVAVSKHMAITHLNSPTVFENVNGMLGSVIEIKGVTFDTEMPEQLNLYKTTWHRALTALDDRYSVYVTIHRQKEDINLAGEFSNDFCRDIDASYQQPFKENALYSNTIYLTVIYKGITSGKAGKGLHFLERLSNKAVKSARASTRESHLKSLITARDQLLSSLSTFNPRIIGSDDDGLGFSELMSFLGLVVNSGKKTHYAFPNNTPEIHPKLENNKKTIELEKKYPEGHLSQYLAKKRLFFGEYIQFQGSIKSDKQFAAIVTIKKYANDSACIMLDSLLKLQCEFISTNTFSIESKDIADKLIHKQMRRLQNMNDPGVSQIDALHEARDMLASDQLAMGYHHNTVMLIADSISALEKAVQQTIKLYSDAGFMAVRETLGQETAFWAQIPTNMQYIARASMITSENFVDFCPLHNYRTGYRDANHLGSAITLLETPSRTPVFFNYHVKGSPDNPSKGHATIVGGNGSGKTALMCFMDAQMNRYGGQTYYFDRDFGAKIYILATGGQYVTLSPASPDDTCFNPFQLSDSAQNRKLNLQLLTQLCKEEGELNLPVDILEQLKRCVDYAYDHLAEDHRYLSNVVKILPVDFPRWPNLRRWLRASGKYDEGEYAYIFDNKIDQLSLDSQKMGFDLTHFLDQEPTGVRTAIMLYLFHRIELSMNGQLVSMILDEGWQYLQDPFWEAKLNRWLPTIRKRNGHLILGTQSPSSIVNSPINRVILDNVATQIFFMNPQANHEDYIKGFKLTDAEFETIKDGVPASRLFLYKQENESILCRLNLSHMQSELKVLSGNTASVIRLDNLINKYGSKPDGWLEKFYANAQ